MKTTKFDVTCGVWKVTDKWGCEFLVTIQEFSNHLGGSFSGPYTFVGNGRVFSCGCFPLSEIEKMEKVH